MEKEFKTLVKCYHCGDNCKHDLHNYDEKNFCCQGCQSVYALLSENNLCDYYDIENNPGITADIDFKGRFDYLDNETFAESLYLFKSKELNIVEFLLPQIHCSSCIWLLENLYRLNDAVSESRVNFLQKKVQIKYNPNATSLKNLVELLTRIGYEPYLNLGDMASKEKPRFNNILIRKMAIAGFAFGNIMLLSFPEYFGLDAAMEKYLGGFFGYLNLLFAIPVFLYSATDYYKSAITGLKHKNLNIDIPIALGMWVLFFRSAYEVLFGIGLGYFDSFAGLVFFMLIGKLFQQKTYDTLSFDRDFRSYFPISVTRLDADKERSIFVNEIKVGDTLLIRSEELIPVDVMLKSARASIDNSFITGEAKPVRVKWHEKIFAGGRNKGSVIEVEVIKELEQSYLTQLWNNAAFEKENKSTYKGITDKVSAYFTPLILFIALASGLYWCLNVGLGMASFVVSAVLIVACPCALALSAPFTFGNSLRLLGHRKFYLKNGEVLEKIAAANHIAFDKTGTITHSDLSTVSYKGDALTSNGKSMIYSLLRQSSHPLSHAIATHLSGYEMYTVDDFAEVPGKGLQGKVSSYKVKIGSADFIGKHDEQNPDGLFTRVYISIDEKLLGYYEISATYRNGLANLINSFKKTLNLSLITGDNEVEKQTLKSLFGKGVDLRFRQSPHDKLNFIKNLQKSGKKVIMVGDGLNDAGALQQSDVGISLSDDINSFSPACDVIVHGENFNQLDVLVHYSKKAMLIIKGSFAISLAYNVVGLSFAISGNLTPIVAAVIMPLSSITVVLFTSISSNLVANKLFKSK